VDPGYTAAHAAQDRAHWWFRGRRAVVLAEMARYLPTVEPSSGGGRGIAEIGCGSGGMLEALGRFGAAVGVEQDPALRERARARGLDVRAGALPHDLPLEAGRWDAVCLFDVLEHVDDEGGSLRACRRLLVPDGRLVVTVPAYAWLWGRHDELLGHRRRYTARSLRAAVQGAGFAIERVTYFNTLLAAPIVAVRFVRTLRGRPEHDLDRPRRLINGLLWRTFAAEAGLLRLGSLPFGISVLLVARAAGSASAR
jgi:SAM-dependent methyltransferase